jgi:hypothetical protein
VPVGSTDRRDPGTTGPILAQATTPKVRSRLRKTVVGVCCSPERHSEFVGPAQLRTVTISSRIASYWSEVHDGTLLSSPMIMWASRLFGTIALGALVLSGGTPQVTRGQERSGERSRAVALKEADAPRNWKRQPEDEECREDPWGCIAGTLLGYVVGPIVQTVFTDIQGSTQPNQAPFAIRLEHRMRGVGEDGGRSHPYLGIGVRSIKEPTQFRQIGSGRPHLEVAVGGQLSLQPLLGQESVLRRSAVIGAEVQWLHDHHPDHVRLQVNPGFSIERPSDRRLLIQFPVAVMVRGAGIGDVSPGISIGYRW